MANISLNTIRMEELTGMVVLVNPALPYDPARRQGQLGVIATSDLRLMKYKSDSAMARSALTLQMHCWS